MNGRFKKRFLFFPVVYALATVFIFSMYFGASRSFSRPWGTGSITGRTGEAGFGRDRSLAVEIDGLAMLFGRGLRYSKDGGPETVLGSTGYVLRGADLELEFGEDFTLEGTYQNGLFTLEGQVDGAGTLSLALRLPEAAAPALEGVPLIRISPTTYLRLPTGTELTSESLELSVPADGKFQIDVLVGDERDPLAIWIDRGFVPPSAQQLGTAVANWVNGAYTGWERTRYQGGRWSFPGSSARFDETTALAFLVESLERGNGSLAATRLDQILLNRPDGLTFATSVFFDDIVITHDDADRIFRSRAQSLETSLAGGDLDALAAEDLLDILIREPRLRSGVTTALQSEGFGNLSTVTIVNLYETLYAYQEGGFGSDFALVGGPTEALLSRISITRDGNYFLNDRGEIDLLTTLRAGRIILDYERNATYRGLGRGLISYVLNYADEAGFLPPSPGRPADISPATVYPFVSPSEYLPRYQFVDDGPEGEIWMWGTLPDVTIDAGSGFIALDFGFPVGLSHYFSIENVPTISQVTLYGLAWNRDFRFQRFTAGWDESGGTVYAKIRHRIPTERFVILY